MLVKMLQLPNVRDHTERIPLFKFQIGAWAVFKPTLPASDRNYDQFGSILDICLAKRQSD
jgi:hypothetical protein